MNIKIKLSLLLSCLSFGCFAQTAQKRMNVVCDGNSLTSGVGTNTASLPYPTQLQRLLGRSFVVTNKGVAAQTTQNMISDYASDIATVYSSSTYRENVLVVWEGRNDLVVNSVTDTQAYNNLVSYCSLGRATGYKIVIVNITPSWTGTYKGNSTVTGYNNLDTDRLSVNSMIASNWQTFADAYVDLSSDTRIGQLGDNEQVGYTFSNVTRPTQNAFYDDGTHFLNTGYGIIAEKIKQAILKL